MDYYLFSDYEGIPEIQYSGARSKVGTRKSGFRSTFHH